LLLEPPFGRLSGNVCTSSIARWKASVRLPIPSAQTLTFKSVTDRQTNKKLNIFGHPGGGWNPSPTKLGMVIENLKHVLSPRKRTIYNAHVNLFTRYWCAVLFLSWHCMLFYLHNRCDFIFSLGSYLYCSCDMLVAYGPLSQIIDWLIEHLGVWRILSPLGGAENLGETRPLNLKPP